MKTRGWLALLLLFFAVAAPVIAANSLRVVVDAGVMQVEYAGEAYVVETSATILVEFATEYGQVYARVLLLDEDAQSATVRIAAVDDPANVIFVGVVRDRDDFEDLFFQHETGRGEQ